MFSQLGGGHRRTSPPCPSGRCVEGLRNVFIWTRGRERKVPSLFLGVEVKVGERAMD
jgi:hypothetical protein